MNIFFQAFIWTPDTSKIYCIYIYSLLLEPSQVIEAKNKIMKVGKILFNNDIIETRSNNLSSLPIIEENNSMSYIEKVLSEKSKSIVSIPKKSIREMNNIQRLRKQLEEFEIERIPLNSNILLFWDSNKNSCLELSMVAKVILSIPMTQVSVERNFSALKFILEDKRSNLTKKNLDNILMVKLNNYF